MTTTSTDLPTWDHNALRSTDTSGQEITDGDLVAESDLRTRKPFHPEEVDDPAEALGVSFLQPLPTARRRSNGGSHR